MKRLPASEAMPDRQYLRVVGITAVLVIGLAVAFFAFASVALATSPFPCGSAGVETGGSGTGTCSYGPAVGDGGLTDTFVVPSYVTSVTVTAIGGKGGSGYAGGAGGPAGGFGSSVTATLSVTPGATMTVDVAGNGYSGSSNAPGGAGTHGGGIGGCGAAEFCGGGGGGASSVLASDSTQLVVAGGGGGGGGGGGATGGAAGAAGGGGSCAGGGAGAPDGTGDGGDAPYSQCQASTQSGDNGPGGNGSAGQGGAGGSPSSSAGVDAGGGGGGGGYGGGGGGQASDQGAPGGGGGGSCYTVGSASGVTVATDTTGRPSVTITWSSYPASIGNTQLPTSAIVGSQISDRANVSGVSPTGWVTFSLYDNPNASGTPLFTDANVQMTDGAAYSTGYTPTSPGNYYWVASYLGDINNAPVTSSPSSAPVTINQASPSLFLLGYPNGGFIGQAAPASWFEAYLEGGHLASGTVTFEVFGPQSSPPSTCEGGTVVGAVSVSGAGEYHSPTGFTLAQQGDYWWYAVYSGDANNTPVNTECGAGMPEDEVGQASPLLTLSAPASIGIVGTAVPASSISADLSGGYAPTGTITFTVFGPQTTPPSAGYCIGGTTVGTASIFGDGTYSSPSSFTPTEPGDYWWFASYDGDTNNQSARSPCYADVGEMVVSTPSSSGSSGTGGSGGGSPAGAGGTGGGTGSAPAQPSRATLVADLNGVLSAATAKGVTTKSVKRAGGLRLEFQTPSGGRLVIDWYATVNHKRVLIGSATTATGAGHKIAVRITLSKQGEALLKTGKSVKVREHDSFTPQAGSTVSATRTVTLKP